MLDDNDYEACFGSRAPTDDSVGSLYTTKTSLLQQAPRERPADTTSTLSVPLQPRANDASSIAGWTVTSLLIQPRVKQFRHNMDMEESSNYIVGNDYSIYDLPVYDTDDGMYSEINLNDDDDDDAVDVTHISSSSDPQLILIKNQKEHDDDDAHESELDTDQLPRRTCLSRLCVRFVPC